MYERLMLMLIVFIDRVTISKLSGLSSPPEKVRVFVDMELNTGNVNKRNAGFYTDMTRNVLQSEEKYEPRFFFPFGYKV
jgi:hypothetical protein